MALEVRKFGKSVNQAWDDPLKPGPLVLYIDTAKMWGARRKLLRHAQVACIHIQISDEAEDVLGNLSEALNMVQAHNPSELLVIASNAAVLPSLATVPALCPAKLLLVNPQPSQSASELGHLLEERSEDFAVLPELKVFWKRGDAYGEELTDALAAVAPHIKERELSDFSQSAAELIMLPAYADSFAQDYFESRHEVE